MNACSAAGIWRRGGDLLPRLRAAAAPWAGRIHFPGPVAHDELPGLFRAADLFVLPAVHDARGNVDGLPNVVLEAMVLRRAVIATAVEGSEDLVVPGQTGWLVAPGDARALAVALHEAAADRARCAVYGDAGRQRVEQQFSQRAVVAAYDRLWSRILGFSADGLKSGPVEPR